MRYLIQMILLKWTSNIYRLSKIILIPTIATKAVVAQTKHYVMIHLNHFPGYSILQSHDKLNISNRQENKLQISNKRKSVCRTHHRQRSFCTTESTSRTGFYIIMYVIGLGTSWLRGLIRYPAVFQRPSTISNIFHSPLFCNILVALD